MASSIAARPGARCEPHKPSLRTTRSSITFQAPFRLKGVRPLQAAGTYKVDSDELVIEGNPRAAPVATRLHLRVGCSIRIRAVEHADLLAAWQRDRAPARTPSTEVSAR